MTLLESRHVFYWSPQARLHPSQLIAAAVSLAAPITYGILTSHLPQASVAALGALAATFTPPATPPTVAGLQPSRFRLMGGVAARFGIVGLVVVAAGFVGTWLGGRGWVTAGSVVGLAAVAAVVGGVSRFAADVTTRFIVFLVIATGLAGDPGEVAKSFAVGAGWAIVVALLVWPFARHQTRPAQPSYRTLWRRWWRNLHRIDGWQYAARLVPCLALAEIIGVLWHQEKAYWIAVAVLIVVRRRGGSLLRATQRCLGTCVGVLIGAAVILWVPPSWAVVAIVAALAGARPLLKDRNYAAYATVMTPLLLLLLDLGRAPDLSIVGYRLADTVIGCLIALLPSVLRRTHVG